MKKLLLLTVLFFGFDSFAQQAEAPKFDCAAEKEHIFADLKKPVECTQDTECGYFDFGYPWQPDVCAKAIINTKKENHNLTMLKIIEQYNDQCIYNNEKENQKYEDFDKKMTEVKCHSQPRVYCYKGFCRTQSYAIYNDQ